MYTKIKTSGLTVSKADKILESNSTGESDGVSCFVSFGLAFFLSATSLSSAPCFLVASVVKTYKNAKHTPISQI